MAISLGILTQHFQLPTQIAEVWPHYETVETRCCWMTFEVHDLWLWSQVEEQRHFDNLLIITLLYIIKLLFSSMD